MKDNERRNIKLKTYSDEKQIEIQMEKALNKIPFEIKKIKFLLSVIKIFKKIKSIFY